VKRNVFLLACLAIMPLGAQASDLYRWVDKSGKMNYGDIPPADATNVERVKLSGDSVQKESLPYETLRAQQNFPVTLYVSKVCGEPCDQARSLLNKRGIPFSEQLIRTKEDVEAFRHLSGIDGVVPVLGVGKDFLKGFSELQWNSALDIAGYPKTAGYRQSTAQPAHPVPFTSPSPVTTPAEGSSSEGQAMPTRPLLR
jgi:hypothetical protein